MKNITYNSSDDENWHSFESIPIKTDILFNGSIFMTITEEHNPSKWVITAKYMQKGNTDFTFVTLYLQRDLPFKIFEVSTRGKSKQYHTIPEKYQGIYDLFKSIISDREKDNPDFVCGVVVLKKDIPVYPKDPIFDFDIVMGNKVK